MIPLTDIAAVLVTRGDVDMQPILDSLPYEEVVVWDNSKRPFDCRVFGRYLAILETTKPVIYVQDDDCTLARIAHGALRMQYEPGAVVANMPDSHRPGEPPMLGWGALFDRDLPWQAFAKWCPEHPIDRLFIGYPESIFTALVPWKRVDLGHTDMPWATAPSRSYQQPGHYEDYALVRDTAMKMSGRDLRLAEHERRAARC